MIRPKTYVSVKPIPQNRPSQRPSAPGRYAGNGKLKRLTWFIWYAPLLNCVCISSKKSSLALIFA